MLTLMYNPVQEPGFLDMVEPRERNVLKGIGVTPHLELALSKPRLAKIFACNVDEERFIRNPSEYIETEVAEKTIREIYSREDVPYIKNLLYALHGVGPQHPDTPALQGTIERPPLSKMHDTALKLRYEIYRACRFEGLVLSGGFFLVLSRPALTRIR